jgi:hypothetical protein
MIADAVRILDRHRVFGDRLNDRDDVDFLYAYLPDAERLAVGTEHAVGALHLARDK